MAFNVVNDTIKASEVSSYINNFINSNVNSRIGWNSQNIPETMRGYFDLSSLPYFSQNSGEVISANAFFSKLANIISYWGYVQPTRLLRYYGSSYGGAISYSLVLDSTLWGRLTSSGSFNPSRHIKALAGSPMKGSHIISFVNSCYSDWTNLPTRTFSQQDCHSSCHDNCHGSGGLR